MRASNNSTVSRDYSRPYDGLDLGGDSGVEVGAELTFEVGEVGWCCVPSESSLFVPFRKHFTFIVRQQPTKRQAARPSPAHGSNHITSDNYGEFWYP